LLRFLSFSFLLGFLFQLFVACLLNAFCCTPMTARTPLHNIAGTTLNAVTCTPRLSPRAARFEQSLRYIDITPSAKGPRRIGQMPAK
jgi:hypothetical protein